MVLKIGKYLSDEKIIKVTAGVDGGFRLRKEPKQIRLLDVIEITEATMKINRCLEKDHYCSRNATDTCPVRKAYCSIQTAFEESLRSVTFEDLLQGDKNQEMKGENI